MRGGLARDALRSAFSCQENRFWQAVPKTFCRDNFNPDLNPKTLNPKTGDLWKKPTNRSQLLPAIQPLWLHFMHVIEDPKPHDCDLPTVILEIQALYGPSRLPSRDTGFREGDERTFYAFVICHVYCFHTSSNRLTQQTSNHMPRLD